MNVTSKVKYVRICRQSTGSWLTLELPMLLMMDQAKTWIDQMYPNFELYSGAVHNPDDYV